MYLLLLLSAAQAQPLVAIVVVDQEARESGYALEIDGWVVDDALPVDVAEGERATLLDPRGRPEPLDLVPGEAWEISGPKGEAWMSKLDEEVRTDLFEVRGSSEAIDALARSLGAEIRREGDRVFLAGEGILYDAPWARDEGGEPVDSVALVPVQPDADDGATGPTAARPSAIASRSGLAPTPALTSASTTPSEGSAPVVEAAPVAAAPPPTATEPPRRELSTVALPVRDADRAPYAGLHLCKDDVLWLHPSGVYAFRGVDGIWAVGAPGVVRLTADTGEVLFRAAIDPDSGFCREVWSPEETGDPTPRAFERLFGRRGTSVE